MEFIKRKNLPKKASQKISFHRRILIPLVILVLFQKPIGFIEGLSFFSYLDELMMLFVVFLIFKSIVKLKINKFIFVLMVVVFYMNLISINQNMISFSNVFLQSVIHLKLFFFYIIIFNFLKIEDIKLILKILFVITIIGITINILLQTGFSGYSFEKTTFRTGMLNIMGFQYSTINLGLTLGIFYLYSIFKVNSSIKHFFLNTLFFVGLILLTGSRAPLVIIPVGIFFYFIQRKPIEKVTVLILMSFVLLAFIVWPYSAEIIDRTINNIRLTIVPGEATYIRGTMLRNGFELFINNFPFGTGVATFGSALSEGSRVYNALGLNSTENFITMTGVYDSNLATIAGELGLVGVSIFTALSVYIYSKAKFLLNKHYVNSIFAALLIYSMFSPVFMNYYPAVLFSLIFVLERKIKEENLNENTNN